MVHQFKLRGRRQICLGKKPAREGAIKFKLESYVDLQRIQPPVVFGHIANRLEAEWAVLGNDVAGCCVVSGAMHETMDWTRATGRPIARFSQALAFEEYEHASGWNGVPNDASDTGLDMQAYASRRQKIGLLDTAGLIHKVKSYAAVDSMTSLIKAAWVFGACGLGIRFPDSAAAQFDKGVPWTVDEKSEIVGGHYVPVVGRNSHGNIVCVTWGRLQAMTPAFLMRYMDEAVAYVSTDYLRPDRDLTPELINETQLDADLKTLAA